MLKHYNFRNLTTEGTEFHGEEDLRINNSVFLRVLRGYFFLKKGLPPT